MYLMDENGNGHIVNGHHPANAPKSDPVEDPMCVHHILVSDLRFDTGHAEFVRDEFEVEGPVSILKVFKAFAATEVAEMLENIKAKIEDGKSCIYFIFPPIIGESDLDDMVEASALGQALIDFGYDVYAYGCQVAVDWFWHELGS